MVTNPLEKYCPVKTVQSILARIESGRQSLDEDLGELPFAWQ
jgi:hypothetical protein